MSFGLVMIVKDEAHGIVPTLFSVKPFIDRWFILDTGSTDGTQDLIREALGDVPGSLVEEPFVDFATTRNRALELAYGETVVPYWLMLSGDERLRNAEALKRFCDDPATCEDAYYVSVELGGAVYNSVRLTRTGSSRRYVGKTHEVIDPTAQVRVPDVLIEHKHDADPERNHRRWELDRDLLASALSEDSTNPRTVYYLAQTFECLGQLEQASEFYTRRIAMGGWREEVYESKARLARIAKRQERPWPEIQQLYLNAYAFAPHRAEPLYEIAKHYRDEENHVLAMVFAKPMAALVLPIDSLPVDVELYEYKRWDLIGISAYPVREYVLGESAVRAALRKYPDNPRLLKNLEFYLARR